MSEGDRVRDLLDCPICLNTFQEPVLLGECGHTFCKRCIEAVRAPLRCPTCRQSFTSRTILPNFALRALLRERDSLEIPLAGATVSAPEAASEGRAGAAEVMSGRESNSLVRLNSSNAIPEDKLAELVAAGLPLGLAKLMRTEDSKIARRIFLLDNSGSTAAPDGQFLEETLENTMFMRKCSRWEEVCHTALEQAQFNMTLGTPCEFFLLNPLARSNTLEAGLDFQVLDATEGDTSEQFKALKEMLASTGPRGVTPISDRLRRINERITPQARELARHNQKIVLVIVTDGLPTSTTSNQSDPAARRELVHELRRLSLELPMHIVIRLCTNDDTIADFYNAVDEEPEIELEVIDDIQSEAQEIWRSGNRWLVYSPLIHLMREGGTLTKLFDLLDERPLEPMEVWEFCEYLLCETADDEKLPTDPHEFCKVMRELVPRARLVYDARRRTMVPPVRLDEVEWMVLPKGPLKRICGQFGQSCEFM